MMNVMQNLVFFAIIGAGRRMHLRLLRPLGDTPNVSSSMLLASTESRCSARPLLERSLSRWGCQIGGVTALSGIAT